MPKMPAGAVNPFGKQSTSGLSIIEEMKRRNRLSRSIGEGGNADEAETGSVEAAAPMASVAPITPIASDEPISPIATMANLKANLQAALSRPKPVAAPASANHGKLLIPLPLVLTRQPGSVTASAELSHIDLEAPPQEVRQLTLLTKVIVTSRVSVALDDDTVGALSLVEGQEHAEEEAPREEGGWRRSGQWGDARCVPGPGEGPRAGGCVPKLFRRLYS